MRSKLHWIGRASLVAVVLSACVLIVGSLHRDHERRDQLCDEMNVLRREIAAQQNAFEARMAIVTTQPEIEERLTVLPEDGQAWYTTLCVNRDWRQLPADRQLVAAFEADPRLASVRVQTRYNVYTPDDAVFKQRFANRVEQLPCVIITRGNGEVIFKSSGPHVAQNEDRLVHQVRTAFRESCPKGRCCPRPKPNVPIPAPVVAPVPPIVEPPLLDSHLQPPEDDGIAGIAVCVGLVSLVGGIIYAWRKQHG